MDLEHSDVWGASDLDDLARQLGIHLRLLAAQDLLPGDRPLLSVKANDDASLTFAFGTESGVVRFVATPQLMRNLAEDPDLDGASFLALVVLVEEAVYDFDLQPGTHLLE